MGHRVLSCRVSALPSGCTSKISPVEGWQSWHQQAADSEKAQKVLGRPYNGPFNPSPQRRVNWVYLATKERRSSRGIAELSTSQNKRRPKKRERFFKGQEKRTAGKKLALQTAPQNLPEMTPSRVSSIAGCTHLSSKAKKNHFQMKMVLRSLRKPGDCQLQKEALEGLWIVGTKAQQGPCRSISERKHFPKPRARQDHLRTGPKLFAFPLPKETLQFFKIPWCFG